MITREYNLFKRNYKAFIKGELNVKIMSEAIKEFISKHDFSAFWTYVKDKPTIKEIYEADLTVKDNDIILRFVGIAFKTYD